jgi:hypothetical protein
MTARFLTPLQVVRAERKLDKATPDAGMWALTRPLRYYSDVLGATIEVPKGFRTDFASVPRLPLAYLLFGGDIGDAAATVHDFLYSGTKAPRKVCDAVFREALKAEGVDSFRSWAMWAGVRMFGAAHYG